MKTLIVIGFYKNYQEYIRVVNYENGKTEIFFGNSAEEVLYDSTKDKRPVGLMYYLKAISAEKLLDEMKK